MRFIAVAAAASRRRRGVDNAAAAPLLLRTSLGGDPRRRLHPRCQARRHHRARVQVRSVFERTTIERGRREKIANSEARLVFARSPFFSTPSSFFSLRSHSLTPTLFSLAFSNAAATLALSTSLRTRETDSATTATSTSRSPNGSTGTRRGRTASTSRGSPLSPPTPR